LFFHLSFTGRPRVSPSFPTRRSSDLTSAITGESIPVEVELGDAVSAGAINSAGALEVETTAAGTDNSLTTIVELVEQAQAEKGEDRKSTRLNSSHVKISYAVFCLKKK